MAVVAFFDRLDCLGVGFRMLWILHVLKWS